MRRNVMFLLGLLLLSCSSSWAALGTCTTAQLLTELSTDPLAGPGGPLSYATAYGSAITTNSVGNDAAVVALLNAVGSGAQFQINRGPVTGLELQRLLDPAEWQGLTVAQQQSLLFLVQLGEGVLDLAAANVRTILQGCATCGPGATAVTGIFANPGPTRTALVAYQNRQGSRMEVLCGRGGHATARDVSCAIRGACQ